MAAAFLSTRNRGAAVLIGIPREDALLSVPALTIPRMERRILGSIYGSARPERDFLTILDLYRRGRLPLDRLVSHRLGGDPLPRYLTGGLAAYRIYETSDGRHLTVAALEPKFFARLCELLGRPDLAERHLVAAEQDALAAELAEIFATRTLDDWLARFGDEDVAVGPVATLAEGAAAFGARASQASSGAIGKDTAAWRGELGLE